MQSDTTQPRIFKTTLRDFTTEFGYRTYRLQDRSPVYENRNKRKIYSCIKMGIEVLHH